MAGGARLAAVSVAEVARFPLDAIVKQRLPDFARL